jgi:nucleoid-associated protein YgaU
MGRKGWILVAVIAAAPLLAAAILYLRGREVGSAFSMFRPRTDRSAPAPTAQAGGDEALREPTAGSASDARVASGKMVTYKVRRGDTLGAISLRFLGSAAKWRAIAKENGIRGSRIKPGMELRITLPGAN